MPNLFFEIAKIICGYYVVVTRTLICFNYKIISEKDIPAWSLAMVSHLWNRVCRMDGKTFQEYLLGNPEIKLPKCILRQRALVVLTLYCWPIVAIFIIWKHQGQRLLQWKFALQRPDLYVAYPSTPFSQEAIEKRRSDMFIGIFNCWDFYLKKSDNYKLDSKKFLEVEASKIGIPVVRSMSLEEAKNYSGPYIVKIPELDMGLGVQLINFYEELLQIQNQENILIQPLLKNHVTWQEILPNNAPLSTLRLITTISDSKPTCHHGEFRIGKSGAIVDNICRGGTPIEMDLQSGKLIAYSPYESTSHPSFKIEELVKRSKGASKDFSEMQLPFFSDTIILVEKAHALLAPAVISIGWDLALIENNWLLIEANIFAGSREVLCFNESYNIANKAIIEKITY